MLSRITLRQEMGREPKKAEVDNHTEKLENKSVPLPSQNAVVAAFESGQEKIYPWKLVCEDYEEDLQREIAISFPHHEKKLKPKKPNTLANKSNAPAKT